MVRTLWCKFSHVDQTDDLEMAAALQRMWDCGGGASYSDFRRWRLSRALVNRMLRSGVVQRTARGAYRLSQPSSSDIWQQRRSQHLMRAASLRSDGSALGLRSAALAWGLPVVAIPRWPEFIRPPHSRTPSGTRVVRRRLGSDEVTLINQLVVTSLERTAVDVALDLPTPQALITVDAALRRGGDPRAMLEILNRVGRVRGVNRARTTLDWGDPHSESALESRGRGELMARGAPRPLCNVSFRIGSVAFRSDLWWDEFKVAGEADGALKYDLRVDDRVLWKEKRRQEWFEEELDIPVLRYIDEEVRLAPVGVYERFVRKVDRRGSSLWVPPAELEIFQRPPPGLDRPVRWLRRRCDS